MLIHKMQNNAAATKRVNTQKMMHETHGCMHTRTHTNCSYKHTVSITQATNMQMEASGFMDTDSELQNNVDTVTEERAEKLAI